MTINNNNKTASSADGRILFYYFLRLFVELFSDIFKSFSLLFKKKKKTCISSYSVYFKFKWQYLTVRVFTVTRNPGGL